jgi:hypothetical protein
MPKRDGWTITHDPLPLKFGEQDVFIDLGAEAPLATEKAGRKIAVEIKSFLGKSEITELERALGQYVLYRSLLRRNEADRSLFLALPVEAYNAVLDSASGAELVSTEGIKLVLYDAAEEVIRIWIE